jgi:hypothetical protein
MENTLLQKDMKIGKLESKNKILDEFLKNETIRKKK